MVQPGKKNVYLYIIVFIIIVGMVLIFFQSQSRIYSYTEFFMDTEVTIKINQGLKERKVVTKAFQEMKKWAKRLNRFQDDSIISKINNSRGQPIRVDTEIMELLIKSKKYYQISNYAFDPTVAPLIDLWGFNNSHQQVPSPTEIRKILAQIGFNKVILNLTTEEILLPANMGLAPGGMAKGFIVDKGSEVLREAGITNFYINAGGNIRVSGKKHLDQSWHIGIKKPRANNEIFQKHIVEIKKGSLATSGDYQRYFIENGIRYSHLLDPTTGWPVREMQSATIYASTALEADILSTAVFIMGWEQGKNLIMELEGVEGFLVKNEEQIWYSQGFSDLVL